LKALLASALTALVIVSAAWASNVTPAQLTALQKRVTALEHRDARLEANLATQSTFIRSCLHHFAPFTIYDETIQFTDGSQLKFSTTQPPDPGDQPSFWLPEAPSSCAS
jgi:hypothetical protein